MVGCMVESSLGTSAGAQVAELADFLDLDGNLLIRNDPYTGPTARNGILSFAEAEEPFGLRVRPRKADPFG
jgi:L-alanine-DL-glutamate epimerase-like enolase superfamily enzyme